MGLSENNIVNAMLTIIVIVVIALAMVLLFPSVSDSISKTLNLGLSNEEKQLKQQTLTIIEGVKVELDKCFKPTNLDINSCFCGIKEFDIPSGYSLIFKEEKGNVKIMIETENGRIISDSDFKIDNVKLSACVYGTKPDECHSDLKEGVRFVNVPPWYINFEKDGREFKNIRLDQDYTFYYYFDNNEVNMRVVSREYAYDKIESGAEICNKGEIVYTDEMKQILNMFRTKDFVCTPGKVERCIVSGGNIYGECAVGEKECLSDGRWSECKQKTFPGDKAENCADLIDNDCDGAIDCADDDCPNGTPCVIGGSGGICQNWQCIIA